VLAFRRRAERRRPTPGNVGVDACELNLHAKGCSSLSRIGELWKAAADVIVANVLWQAHQECHLTVQDVHRPPDFTTSLYKCMAQSALWHIGMHSCGVVSPCPRHQDPIAAPCAKAMRSACPMVTCAAFRESKACRYSDMQHNTSTATTGSRHKRLVSGRSCRACTKKSAPGGLGA
jgi:hypothetical protein